jgi:levanase/fructan beta-fructosidase
MWENMTWGHSTSKDLIHWEAQPTAIEPDALGDIFSGSCVVDKKNDRVVAFYTSAGERAQIQSMAISTDNGQTFKKYKGNPVLVSKEPDFRDPKCFWNPEIQKWNMILAVGQEMRIYSSKDLTDWTYESSFGISADKVTGDVTELGCHDGVWECPDLMKLQVRGTDKQKWMLICNINPGGPFGGSATQYFIGDFDGHKFTCDHKDTRWMDYGKDHYATVTFDTSFPRSAASSPHSSAGSGRIPAPFHTGPQIPAGPPDPRGRKSRDAGSFPLPSAPGSRPDSASPGCSNRPWTVR